MACNDLTPLLEACKNINGFSEYEYPKIAIWPTCPYIWAANMVMPEYWQQYLDRAIEIAMSSQNMDTFNARIKALNLEIASKWYDKNKIL